MAYYAITTFTLLPRSRRITVRLTASTLVRRLGRQPGRSGPLLDGETPAGALLIAKVDSVEAAERWLFGFDPMNIGGAVCVLTP